MTVAKLELVGFEKFRGILKPNRFGKVMRKHVALGTRRGAQLIQRNIRQGIKKGIKPANAALTLALKKPGTKPLVGKTSDLFNAIAITQPDFGRAFIGIKKTDDVFNIAQVLHDGKTIPISKKMRGLFFVLWLASVARKTGGGDIPLTGRALELFRLHQDWKPLTVDKRVIKIPARPFIADAFNASKQQVIQKWKDSIQSAFRELVRGPG